jgi:diguanylate cyclase (GGDEF)-like protein
MEKPSVSAEASPNASGTSGAVSAAQGDDPTVDPLTKLPTRRAFQQALTQAFARVTKDQAGPALLALDLDRFQAVNDSTGIVTGDLLLTRAAARIVGAVPQGSTVARISGDEFTVLIPDASAAEAVAERLLDLLGRTYAVNGHTVTLSVSIGLALAPQHGADAVSLLRSATIALHAAEADGKNKWRVFDPAMQAHASAQQQLESDLRAVLELNRRELGSAMAVEQFEVHYQPQVDIGSGRLTGFEALVRWRHPDRGMVSPMLFIPLLEQIGLIGLLGDWVLNTACRAAAAWPVPHGGKPLTVSVNVSPIQLREGRAMVASVARALKDSGLDPLRLDIEITESAMLRDALETLQSLKGLGVGLSLDDFGTGFSSLSQLAGYPFDRLKIDKSFVDDLSGMGSKQTSVRDRAFWMIKAIASLGSGLGIGTTAEGVETAGQLDQVRSAGVTHMQGYLVARPLPEAQVRAQIDRLSAPLMTDRPSHLE